MTSNKVKITKVIGNRIALSANLKNPGDLGKLRTVLAQLWPDKEFSIGLASDNHE